MAISAARASADLADVPSFSEGPSETWERRKPMTGSKKRRRNGRKRAAGKCERINETTTVARLVLVIWEWILALHEHITHGGTGRIL
jgi:hypothetical protein